MAFTTLSSAILATEKCFAEVAITVNKVTSNDFYNVSKLWPKNVFTET